jgi:uncharacterized protein YukE
MADSTTKCAGFTLDNDQCKNRTANVLCHVHDTEESEPTTSPPPRPDVTRDEFERQAQQVTLFIDQIVNLKAILNKIVPVTPTTDEQRYYTPIDGRRGSQSIPPNPSNTDQTRTRNQSARPSCASPPPLEDTQLTQQQVHPQYTGSSGEQHSQLEDTQLSQQQVHPQYTGSSGEQHSQLEDTQLTQQQVHPQYTGLSGEQHSHLEDTQLTQQQVHPQYTGSSGELYSHETKEQNLSPEEPYLANTKPTIPVINAKDYPKLSESNYPIWRERIWTMLERTDAKDPGQQSKKTSSRRFLTIF